MTLSVPWPTTPVPESWNVAIGDTVTIVGNKQGWKFIGQIVDYESSTDRVMIKTVGMDGVWFATLADLIC